MSNENLDLDNIADVLAEANGIITSAVPLFGALLGLARLGYDVIKRQQAGQSIGTLAENLAVMRAGASTLVDRANEWDAANPKDTP